MKFIDILFYISKAKPAYKSDKIKLKTQKKSKIR